MRTVAPARTAPLVSLTVPTTVALVSVCPKMERTGNANRKNANSSVGIFFEIIFHLSARENALAARANARRSRASRDAQIHTAEQPGECAAFTYGSRQGTGVRASAIAHVDGNRIGSDAVSDIDKVGSTSLRQQND